MGFSFLSLGAGAFSSMDWKNLASLSYILGSLFLMARRVAEISASSSSVARKPSSSSVSSSDDPDSSSSSPYEAWDLYFSSTISCVSSGHHVSRWEGGGGGERTSLFLLALLVVFESPRKILVDFEFLSLGLVFGAACTAGGALVEQALLCHLGRSRGFLCPG